MLNCQLHDISVLVAARILKPLGNPAANAIKFFATSEVNELAKDRTWLVKLTNAVNQHWQHQNNRKLHRTINGSGNNHASLVAASSSNGG